MNGFFPNELFEDWFGQVFDISAKSFGVFVVMPKGLNRIFVHFNTKKASQPCHFQTAGKAPGPEASAPSSEPPFPVLPKPGGFAGLRLVDLKAHGEPDSNADSRGLQLYRGCPANLDLGNLVLE